MLCGRSKTTQDAVQAIIKSELQDAKARGKGKAKEEEISFVMEEKLDGERIQLHKRGNEFYFCSRSAKKPSKL